MNVSGPGKIMYICMYLCIYACMYVCTCMYVCMCVHVCMYICILVGWLALVRWTGFGSIPSRVITMTAESASSPLGSEFLILCSVDRMAE